MVKTLEYNTNLSLDEAQEKLEEVKMEFEKVKINYGFFNRLSRRDISPEDNKILADCFGVLLPLSHYDSIQDQVRLTQNIKNTLHYQIQQLSTQILDYLSNFENSGVGRLG